jgi:guanylate kinase
MSASQRKAGIPFVIAAPSGTGKTTVCRRLLEHEPRLRLSVSHTTRAPRVGEQDGVAYHFVTAEEFLELQEDGAFIESANYNGKNYGTSWQAIREPVADGHCVLLEIEVQGARQVRERRDDVRFIFLLPPSMKVLGERLRNRGTDDSDTINQRLAIAYRELESADLFDYAIVNDDLDRAVAQVREIIEAECDENPEEVRAKYGRERVLESWREENPA